ncbi:MAG: MFS transporter [Verrucomicrobiales bacterium]|nr:MFS transporter [Verrucomicrobiales bacterium]
MSNSTPQLTSRLSIMMFLQFFVWGAWFATLGQCLGSNNLTAFAGDAYGTAPLGAIFAPLFLGIIADRFFPSQKVMAVLFLIGGVFLFLIPNVAGNEKGDLMVWFMLGNMLTYMPTVALGNSIVFTHANILALPKIRVWGTIGWIVAGLVVGFLGWTSDLNMFYLAGGASLLLGLYSFTLPNTPPPAKGEPIDLRALFMVDAFKLFKRPAFLVFMVCSCLVCIPLAYYYGLAGNYLTNTGYTQAASTMTIGQMSEIFFMLLIPFFFRKLGVKWMILIGMLAWVLRYLLFAYGAPDQVVWMILLGVALHGICFDFFFVTGFMYTDKIAPKSIRTQAQSLLVFFTQGIGLYIGYKVAYHQNTYGKVAESYNKLNDAIGQEYAQETLSVTEKLGQMFSKNDLAKIDPSIVGSAMEKWSQYWKFPAIMAGVIAVIFFVAFWDKISITSDDENSSE